MSVVGVCLTQGDPLCMVCEYGERGDLYHFLQDHVAETSRLSKSPGVPTLRYYIHTYVRLRDLIFLDCVLEV